ncbi:MAG: enoyl-CoA hydratase [Burkholderiales bacterium]|nr:enoyl-CoA hydratase [Burkholderiales bacterium]
METNRDPLPPPVLVSRDGATATITLNRPAQFNALSEAVLVALQSALDAVAVDRDILVVVLRGAGRAFCAGHDLREMRAHPAQAWQRALFDRCSRVMMTLESLPQPVIAAVHGIATAAGCQLVATCDLAIATQSARFATSGVNLGLFCSTPAVALTQTLAAKHAAEMLFTGDFIDANRALAMGLVNRVVDDDALDEAVAGLAAQLAGKSPHALMSGKALLRQLRRLHHGEPGHADDAYALAAANMARDMIGQDAQRGIDAFLARQPLPVWQRRCATEGVADPDAHVAPTMEETQA